METRKTNLMIWSLLGLTALALFLFAAVDNAEAKVRVQATVRTPYGAVHIDNGSPARYRSPRVLPARGHYYVKTAITKRDRKIAKRLARYTGVSQREILRLRRQGYRWGEIGNWLDLPRPVIRAAQHQQSWQRFLRHNRGYEKCGTRSHRNQGARWDG
jgi:hypothetical protein